MTTSSWLNFGHPAPPGRGSATGRKCLALPYYSQRAVFSSLWALFSLCIVAVSSKSRPHCRVERLDAVGNTHIPLKAIVVIVVCIPYVRCMSKEMCQHVEHSMYVAFLEILCWWLSPGQRFPWSWLGRGLHCQNSVVGSKSHCCPKSSVHICFVNGFLQDDVLHEGEQVLHERQLFPAVLVSHDSWFVLHRENQTGDETVQLNF